MMKWIPMTEVRLPGALMRRTRARMRMIPLKGCHHRAIHLREVLDLDHPAPKGCLSLETILVEKNVPGLAPFLIGLDRRRRSRLHRNEILSSTRLALLERRCRPLRGLRVRPHPRGAELLDCAGQTDEAFLISTLVHSGLRSFNPFCTLKHCSCTHHLVK